ncbi:antitoxin component YwqK of YwqJK toxin-antitoxin module [Tenacibaculum skagerrakense]|uniref:Antitoxin component YwqK of YwqJK toxin-antitoxin module n=1 Tax=Tenacibaculum skagerrakense TaxID=186571 RepID=A0A4R2NS67_9FLAO|nr:toxin-antitoxin system YwqK family antitoxin [Tenacibaculum skagerrakense]TCP24677.1 antitoxin component YwqK of YwqJK toxin-antitoxin module [Tenacibaculum skagerrakense]
MVKVNLLIILSFVVSSFIAFSQKTNQLDANGKRDGIWRKFYDNGDIRYEGEFQNGKEIGTFTFYNQGSSYPSIVKIFSKKSDTATVKFFNKSRVKTTGKMVGKKRVGKWIYYFEDGKRVFSEENYKDGLLNGVVKNFYDNGNVTEETHYKEGKKHGSSKIYTENGVLIEDVNYVDGKLNGLAKYFDIKGVIKEKGIYADGARAGKWEYYIDGEVSEKGRPRKNMLKNDEKPEEEEE